MNQSRLRNLERRAAHLMQEINSTANPQKKRQNMRQLENVRAEIKFIKDCQIKI